MQFPTSLAILTALILPVASVSVTYDTVYDNRDGSLDTVACSNGPNGLKTRGFNKFGDLPNFPFIGGAAEVAGWNSPRCGSCYALTFTDGQGVKKSINILAVDHAANGLNIGLQAMNTLTNGHGVEYGVVDVSYKPVSPHVCGL
ncbi:hypothetical protein HGRIS_013736 [Hohenbuehelia grisea]|uniref:Cerato-platanin n=1 Tax=Hohenbuehelia grisea TaxID=104357 RepID=A0ABR3IWM7_9AGAR